jgi:rfaE bifunctional protein kinase chain/domain
MLDHFVFGRVDRISPEAPVPVVEFDHEDFRVGGAGNVAHNVRGLGGAVEMVAVIGRDDHGARLKEALGADGIGVRGVVTEDGRPTTRKMRLVTSRNQQVARVDYETDREVKGDIEAALVAAMEAVSSSVRAIVISDYLKGSVTRAIVARAIGIARDLRVPLLVDPKIPHLDYYTGATLPMPRRMPLLERFAIASAARVCSSPAANRACGCSTRAAKDIFRRRHARSPM